MSTLSTSHMLIVAGTEDVQVRLCDIASGPFLIHFLVIEHQTLMKMSLKNILFFWGIKLSWTRILLMRPWWEPRHSRHKRFYGKQYVKLGGVIRHFAYTVVALHGCIQTEIQTPQHVRVLFKDPCTRLAEEISTVLKELANSIHNRYACSPEILSDHLHEALRNLNTFKAQPRLFIGPATQTSEILACEPKG
ncbi:aluminum-activated malate transporter 12-like [Apium graveolens]|uniref:aluminum-activated malate transporter 12-like n=1 Tax=Apium graveolens TaxID=4045 RepID=UPI003D79733A